MDWKLGEIRQVESEWYQCVAHSGYKCDFNGGIIWRG